MVKELVFKIPYDSVDDIPLSEYKNLHKQYWEFVANRNSTELPEIISSDSGNRVDIHFRCFACEYVFRACGKLCYECPISKSDLEKQPYFWCCNGLFKKWADAKTQIEAENVANKIANLEWEDTHEN